MVHNDDSGVVVLGSNLGSVNSYSFEILVPTTGLVCGRGAIRESKKVDAVLWQEPSN